MDKTINQYINQLHLDPKKEAVVRKLVTNVGGNSSKKLPKNGIYIYDIYGDFTLFKDFSPNKSDTALGVALIDTNSKFIIPKFRNSDEGFKFGNDGNYAEDIFLDKDSYNGIDNTIAIAWNSEYSTSNAMQYALKHSQYIGSLKEYELIRDNKTEINNALSVIGGEIIPAQSYLTSTGYSYNKCYTIYLEPYTHSTTSMYRNAYIKILPLIKIEDNVEDELNHSFVYKQFQTNIEYTDNKFEYLGGDGNFHSITPKTQVGQSLSYSVPEDIKYQLVNIAVSQNYKMTGLVNGQELHTIIHNTGNNDISITMPYNDSNYVCLAMEFIIPSGGYAEINAIKINNKIYLRHIV